MCLEDRVATVAGVVGVALRRAPTGRQVQAVFAKVVRVAGQTTRVAVAALLLAAGRLVCPRRRADDETAVLAVERPMVP